jgi:2-polyprenyl-3-methyl-5-hydroxy-6-metoxy-1,4-benzoquinol methylase
MQNLTPQEQINKVLRNKPIYNFFKKTITDGYLDNANGHKSEMERLLKEAFSYIEKSIDEGTDINEVIKTLSDEIFKTNDSNFWFTNLYSTFKKEIKPIGILNLYEEYLVGKKILNVGCGDGIYSKFFAEHGYEVSMTDVMDFRDKSTYTIPFRQMTIPRIIPYEDKSVDTTVILSVLHHANVEDVEHILREAKRVSKKRIIVEEESFGIQENESEFEEKIESDKRLKEFIAKSDDEQIQYMKLLDYFSNVVIMRVPDMNFPFGYKTINQWRQLFSKAGFKTVKTILIGFGRFHRTGRVAFILDVSN